MAEQASKPVLHKGTVKLVQSGDTVIIRGVPRNGPPPEKVLSLSGISCPRLARRPHPNDDADKPKEVDEPMAWEAREFLRKKLVGQSVEFEVEYTAGAQGRDYGTVYLNGENITKSLLVAGLVKVRREEDAELVAAGDIGKIAGLGLYQDPKILAAYVTKSTIKHTLPCTPAEFIAKFEGKEVTAIVEHVRDGSNFRALLLPSMQSISVGLTGIRAPGFKRGADGKDEPFAAEAKYFLETRLLQQQVKLVLESTSGPTSILASVLHPKGSISEILLKEGFAKINDNSITYVKNGGAALRAAEEGAKAAKKRYWKTFQAVTLDIPEADRKFTAVVKEIINPERIRVKKADGSEVELSLASLRQPRRMKDEAPADGADEGRRKKPLYDTPYMFEAREFLRELTIGKEVAVTIDYIKPSEGKFPEKTCVTIIAGSTNVAEGLISRGLATCLTHDFQRASQYDAMLQAEFRAKSQKKGVHGPNVADHVVRVGEVTSKDAGNRYVNAIKRSGKVDGIVEYVSSGSRIRVYIAKENVVATMMLAGISVPRTGFKDSPSEPFADAAMAYVKDLCMQQTVSVEVHDTDSKGNFIGQVFLNGKNLAELLLAKGFGEVHFSASRYGVEAALTMAMGEAKGAKLGMWENYDPTKVDKSSGAAEVLSSKAESVVITHVVNSTSFYAQSASAGEAMEKVAADMLACEKTPVDEKTYKNHQVAAKFAADGLWYRAVVERVVEKAKTYEIRFIDYGNSETVDVKDLAVLTDELKEVPAKSTLMKLSLLDNPPEDYEDEATETLRAGIQDKEYECTVDYADEENVKCVTLESEEDEKKINVAVTMLQMGYARAGRTRERALRERETQFKAIQKQASNDHTGMWQYGDISEDPKDI